MILIFVALAALVTQTQDLPPSRAGIVLFKMPADRERQEDSRYTVLKAGGDAAKGYDIRIRPAAEAKGSVTDALDAHAAFLATTYAQVRPANDFRTSKHSAGYDACYRPYFLAGADGRPSAAYVFILQSGAKSVAIEFVAPDAKNLADVKPIVEFVEACRLAHAEVLVPGTPPLTVYDVEETFACIQWLLDVSFTADQKEVFRAEILDGWKKKDAETIQSVAQILQLRGELAKLTPEQQDVVRKQSEGEMLAELRKQKDDRCAKLLVEIYDASRKPIAEGDPALTRQQADAALELFYFMAAQLEGISAKPTLEEKNEWAKRIAEGWAKLNPAARKVFGLMPLTWSATQAGWAEIPAPEKEAIQKGFAQMDLVKELRTHFAKAKSQGGADAAATLSKMQSDRQLTMSLLKTGYDSTMTQMAAMRNMTDTRNHWSYRPR